MDDLLKFLALKAMLGDNWMDRILGNSMQDALQTQTTPAMNTAQQMGQSAQVDQTGQSAQVDRTVPMGQQTGNLSLSDVISVVQLINGKQNVGNVNRPRTTEEITADIINPKTGVSGYAHSSTMLPPYGYEPNGGVVNG